MEQDKIIVEKNIACTLSDGTILRADVYRPDNEAQYPVLLLRLPYDKETPRYYDEYLNVPRMVKAGYVVILQDVRGRFASDGEFYPFIDEGKDGYEAVEWAAALPYSNGKVGMFGMSYHGYTQLAAAVEKPPSLKAIAPVMTMADPWTDMIGEDGGASGIGKFETWTLGSIVEDQLKRRNDPKAEKVGEYIENLPDWLSYAPANEWPPMKDLDPDSFFFDIVQGKLTDALKDRVRLNEKLQKVGIPALFIGGWFDALLEPTLQAYQAYGGERMLWIGPWTHEEMTGRAGDVFFENAEKNIGVDRLEDPTEIHIQWFDKWLKDKPMQMEKPVHLYLMGQKKWEAYDVWPPETSASTLFLQSDGASQTRGGDGLLATESAAGESASDLKLDPASPVPTRGGGSLIAGVESGIFEVGDIQDRNDVLVYTSVPLERDWELLGAVKAHIWIAAPSILCDLGLRLSEVDQGGNVTNIIDTFHRERVEKVNTPFCVELEIGHTAYVIQKGHRIRLDITASNAPLYDVNLNNGQTTKTDSSGQTAFEKVYQGGRFTSKIEMPVVDRGF